MMKLTIAVVIAMVHIKTSGNRDIHTEFVMAILVDKGQIMVSCVETFLWFAIKEGPLKKHKNWKLCIFWEEAWMLAGRLPCATQDSQNLLNIINFSCVKTHQMVVEVEVVLVLPWPYLDLALSLPWCQCDSCFLLFRKRNKSLKHWHLKTNLFILFP